MEKAFQAQGMACAKTQREDKGRGEKVGHGPSGGACGGCEQTCGRPACGQEPDQEDVVDKAKLGSSVMESSWNFSTVLLSSLVLCKFSMSL